MPGPGRGCSGTCSGSGHACPLGAGTHARTPILHQELKGRRTRTSACLLGAECAREAGSWCTFCCLARVHEGPSPHLLGNGTASALGASDGNRPCADRYAIHAASVAAPLDNPRAAPVAVALSIEGNLLLPGRSPAISTPWDIDAEFPRFRCLRRCSSDPQSPLALNLLWPSISSGPQSPLALSLLWPSGPSVVGVGSGDTRT